jgi:hypothetical protein
MTLAQVEVRDERQEKRLAFGPTVSRQIATFEAVQSRQPIIDELVARFGVFLFYGALFGVSGWNLFRLIMAVAH